MRVLVACEFSGIVRDAFTAKGHDAWSCDLLPSERPGNHIKLSIFELLNGDGGWDIMIFHWPCTTLCNSGVRWLFGGKGKIPDDERWGDMEVSARCFRNLLDWPTIPRICGENPIPHGHAMKFMGKWTQKIQPWQFGHPESKATCLWLKGLPPLNPTNNVRADFDRIPSKFGQRVFHESPGPNRWRNRSRTYEGVAKAMANQWEC